MTSLVGVSRCAPLRAVAGLPAYPWLPLHLLLYFVLDLATLAALSAIDATERLPAAAQALLVVFEVFVAVWWALPFHGAALLLVAGVLAALRSLAHLRWWWFRLVALAAFVLPAYALALLLSGGDAAASLVVLPMHTLMGLVVVQPRSLADVDPAMDHHVA